MRYNGSIRSNIQSNMKILLGITGGVAAFKTAFLVRALRALKMDVRVVMTKAATAFITPLTLQALSGHPVRVDVLDTDTEHAMGHIEFARWADCFLIAPATANCIAKLAQGLADDLLTTLALVFQGPVLICPSMNHSMWHHPATVENCARLRHRGVNVLGPNEGEQACGEYGLGRMVEVEEIVARITQLMAPKILRGQHVIITAGPTREAIDPVRYLSNYSSGKMGFALAEAALCAGASVTLITGPTALQVPVGVDLVRVESGEEMHQAVMSALETYPQSIFIGAAAVADYTVKTPASTKLKKTTHTSLTLELTLTRDILMDVVHSQRASFVVGFAAETSDIFAYAEEKLVRKKLDMIVANRVGRNLGFEVDDNEVTVLTSTSKQLLTRASKRSIATNVIAIIATSLQNTGFSFSESEQTYAINNSD